MSASTDDAGVTPTGCGACRHLRMDACAPGSPRSSRRRSRCTGPSCSRSGSRSRHIAARRGRRASGGRGMRGPASVQPRLIRTRVVDPNLHGGSPAAPQSGLRPAEQLVNPGAHLLDGIAGRSPVEPFVEDVVVAELDCPRDQCASVGRRDRRGQARITEQRKQLAKVVNAGRRHAGVGERGLEQLLQCLLSVEADHVVWYVGIVGELVEGDLVATCLARKSRCKITQIRFRRGHGPL